MDNDIRIMINAARAAGRSLKTNRHRWNIVTADMAHDVKLQADREAESIIIKILQSKTDYPILTEETGDIAGDGGNGLRWIIDPLDGTVNYSTGIPLSAVSIGLWRKNNPVYGVIYDFWRNELFEGGPATGSFLDKKPIQISGTTKPEQAILTTGFPSGDDFNEKSLRRFIESVKKFKKIRLIGSAALSLAYVACGRVDAYVEEGIMLWDVAAGAAIIKGAGGKAKISSIPGKTNLCSIIASGRLPARHLAFN